MTTPMQTDTKYVQTNNTSDGTTSFKVPAIIPPPGGPPWKTPPPVGSLFLPNPDVALWKLKVQHDFRTVTSLPADDWSYGGRPGGVPRGCIWSASQISFDRLWGLLMAAGWSASQAALMCAAFGTTEDVPAPWYMRVYECILDGNIEGLNHLMLAWNKGPGWSNECDNEERAIVNGLLGLSTARQHDGTSAVSAGPVHDQSPSDAIGEIYVRGASVDDRSGTPLWTITRNGGVVGTAMIPSSNMASLKAVPHWMGVQTESYTGAQTSATSRRAILGVEIYVAV